jgi:hypothetical protein
MSNTYLIFIQSDWMAGLVKKMTKIVFKKKKKNKKGTKNGENGSGYYKEILKQLDQDPHWPPWTIHQQK